MSNKMSEKLVVATVSAPKSRKRMRAVYGFALIIFGSLLVVSGVISARDDRQKLIAPKGAIAIEIAHTESERATGLMNRREMDKDSGMLFIFDSGNAKCFWMKDTFIPLDMVWLDDSKKVVFVHSSAEPNSETPICPDVTATYVLEVNAGRAEELGLSIGAQAHF